MEKVVYFVYVLHSSSLDRFYVGQTNDIDDRFKRHNLGHEKYTKNGIPWVLVWSTRVSSRSEAMKLEKQIKKRGAKRFLEKFGA